MKETLNPRICAWCANKGQEVCYAHCQEELRYRYLVPASLARWESPPELPPFRDLLDYPAVERLALIYLCTCYLTEIARETR
jgi:hypothetical protein